MSQTTAPAKLTLTIPEGAAALGVCEQTLRSAIKAGQIPHIMIGRRILIPRRQFERMLETKLAESSK